MNLSNEQIQALDRGQAVPLTVDGRACVVIRREVYERAKPAIEYDASEWTAEEMRSVMARTMDDDWSDPRVDVYDEPS